MSCNRPAYRIDNYPDCSGNGQCVNRKCVCYDGWTSFTDNYPTDGYDCDVNITAIRSMGILLVFLSSISVIVTTYSLITQGFLTERFKKKESINRYVNLHLVLATLSYFTVGLLKIINPVKFIAGGHNPRYSFVTVHAYWISATAACFSISYFYLLMVNILKGYALFIDPSIRECLFNRLDRISFHHKVFPWLTALTVFITGFSEIAFHLEGDIISISLIGQLFIVYFFYGASVLHTTNLLLQELERYLSLNDCDSKRVSELYLEVKTVVRKLKVFYRAFLFSTVIGTPGYLLFLVWNFLWRKCQYLFLFTCIVTQTILICISWSLSLKRNVRVFPSILSSKSANTTTVKPIAQKQISHKSFQNHTKTRFQPRVIEVRDFREKNLQDIELINEIQSVHLNA